MRTLGKMIAIALQRLRLARIERQVRQTEDFLAREQELHAEQMLWLRTRLAQLRDERTLAAGEAHEYRSGALQ